MLPRGAWPGGCYLEGRGLGHCKEGCGLEGQGLERCGLEGGRHVVWFQQMFVCTFKIKVSCSSLKLNRQAKYRYKRSSIWRLNLMYIFNIYNKACKNYLMAIC